MFLLKLAVALFVFFTSTSYALDSLKVLSYNLGLAHTFVPHAKERLPHLIKNLRESQSDVLCLQEVWTESDRKKIINNLSGAFPYYQKLKIKQKYSRQKPTCKIRNVIGKGKFVNCLTKHCRGTSGDEFTSCIIKKCRGSLERLKEKNSDCAQGILSQVGKTTLQALMAVFNPFKGAGLFSYKGSDGLLLLSKYKLLDKKTIELEDISTGSRRRVLLSTLDFNGQKVKVGCTHLTANLSRSIPYTGEFSGWAMENKAQVKTIISKVSDIQEPLILAGDYNCSLKDEGRGVKDEFPRSCEIFLEENFMDLFYKEIGLCTFCEKNTLVKRSTTGDQNFLLDHIFSKNIQATSSDILYENMVTILKEGKEIPSNLSDHYGVLVEFDL